MARLPRRNNNSAGRKVTFLAVVHYARALSPFFFVAVFLAFVSPLFPPTCCRSVKYLVNLFFQHFSTASLFRGKLPFSFLYFFLIRSFPCFELKPDSFGGDEKRNQDQEPAASIFCQDPIPTFCELTQISHWSLKCLWMFWWITNVVMDPLPFNKVVNKQITFICNLFLCSCRFFILS